MEDLAAMNRRHALIAYILIASTLVLALIVRASETRAGSWTIARSDEPGKVSFALIYHSKHNNSNHQSDWPTSEFHGVDFSKSGKQDVKFAITRDAGRFDCEGYLNNGEGAGLFHFTPDTQYVSQMSALGFIGIDEEKQFSMAILDVSVSFAKEIKSKNVHGLDTDKLIAFRIFNVSSEFIDALRKAGLPATDADKLVAFRRRFTGNGRLSPSVRLSARRRYPRRYAHPWCLTRLHAEPKEGWLRSHRPAKIDCLPHSRRLP